MTVRIIGAGLGGLSAAIHLAAAGREVVVHERQSAAGGKASELRSDGFRFDTGPSLLTMPFVLDELYDIAGALPDERVELVPVDPICRYHFSDGTLLDASSDEEEFLAQVRNFSPGEDVAVRRFLDYSQRIYELTSDIFLFNSLGDLKKLLRLRNLPTLLQLPRIDAFRSVHEGVTSFFRDVRLQQLFDRYATYNGSDPYQAPATLNIIPYVEYRLGGYYVRGGMYALVQSLYGIAIRLGVRFNFGSDVEGLETGAGRLRGLREGGCLHTADAIVSNADAVFTMSRLAPLSERAKRKYEKLEPSCSGLVFLWGVRGTRERLAQHNIFFSENYREEFEDIFSRLRAPADPTVYVSITSREDPAHAPEGHENWFVLVNMPYLTEENRAQSIVSIRNRVLARLNRAGFDIEKDIVYESAVTPVDLELRFNANRGSIYGISSNARNAAFLRPQSRVRSVPGLYLCGGAAHPGGGVPLVLLSGRLAAEAVLEDTEA
ncbi:MAG: phytoene desaturase family protein [Bacteroidota bacterium]|nr:phytoene desaturase family protein [Bacteroidota bacterium]